MLIRKNIEDAAAQREQSEKVLAEYQANLDSVQIEAKQILEAARLDTVMLREKAMQKLDDDIRKKKQIVQSEIEYFRRQAMKEIRNTSAELVLMATEKLIKKKMDTNDAKRIVEDAIREIKRLKDEI